MSKVSQCPRCGKNIVESAYDGDGDYPVEPMCRCPDSPNARNSCVGWQR